MCTGRSRGGSQIKRDSNGSTAIDHDRKKGSFESSISNRVKALFFVGERESYELS